MYVKEKIEKSRKKLSDKSMWHTMMWSLKYNHQLFVVRDSFYIQFSYVHKTLALMCGIKWKKVKVQQNLFALSLHRKVDITMVE